MKIVSANKIAPDGTPGFAASHLGLSCLPTYHKKDARLIWVNPNKHGVLFWGDSPRYVTPKNAAPHLWLHDWNVIKKK